MDPSTASNSASPSAAAGAAPPVGLWSALRRSWQIPALGLGGVALAAGFAVSVAVRTSHEPTFDAPFATAEGQIAAEKYEDAIATLNEGVFPYLARGDLTRPDRARYALLLGRAIYGGQRELDVPQRANDENALGQLLEAERLDAALSAEDVFRVADTLVALGRPEEALERAAGLPSGRRDLADRVVRRVVEGYVSGPAPRYEDALRVLAGRLAQPDLPRAERLWALARQAEVRIETGFADEAINRLVRELPLLVGGTKPEEQESVGELRLLLGRAYLAVGAYSEALAELERVDRDAVLRPGTAVRARAQLLRGQAQLSAATDAAGIEAARDVFAELVERSGNTDVYWPALLGLSQCEAGLDRFEESLTHSGVLVAEMKLKPGRWAKPTVAEVTASLLARFRELFSRGDITGALAAADDAFGLHTLETAPAEVLEALALAHRAAAEEVIGPPSTDGTLSSAAASLLQSGGLDPAAQQQVKRHLIQAAGYYRTHADRFVLDDFPKHADSLWTAAELYDRAGDKREAIRAYQEFAGTVTGDPRQPEARFRLGRAFQAIGDYEAAAGQYAGLIEEWRAGRSGGPGESGASGRWADASHVPLAQCLLADANPDNDEEALRLLNTTLGGTFGGPGRLEYAAALVELGRLHYRGGRYNEAVERFDEWLQRESQAEGGGAAFGLSESFSKEQVRFMLADSHRLLAGQIDERLKLDLRSSEAEALAAQREGHLREAIVLYEGVRDGLSQRDARRLQPVEELYLRNSHFYLGDCAYELGDIDTAVAHYTAARAAYPRDPAVLVALVQIVNAYLDRGDLRAARTANERARDFYRSLPEEVWNDPNLPMGREAWQRWLDSSSRLYDEVAVGG